MNLNAPLTHPETAWLVYAPGPALAAAIVLLATLLLRGPLALALAQAQIRRESHRLAGAPRPDPALLWMPATLAPERLLACSAGAACLVSAIAALTAPLFIALALGAPLVALLIGGLLNLAERHYVAQLDRDLTATVGRLSALLRSGSGFRVAVERLLADMQPGPLREEWAFLLERQGVPMAGGGIATPHQVVAALACQTPSARHAALLDHLSVAVGQPQDVLARRCAAAYTALQASDRRRDEALTELAQMRYSGIVVGLAGLTMAAYLLWAQWERVVLAYSTPLGLIVGPLVALALLLPIAGGVLLSRVDDVEY